LDRLGGAAPDEELLLDLLAFLAGGPRFIVPVTLHGYRRPARLLQINADTIGLERLEAEDRYRCSVCNYRMAWV
jgi:hypothetical protein